MKTQGVTQSSGHFIALPLHSLGNVAQMALPGQQRPRQPSSVHRIRLVQQRCRYRLLRLLAHCHIRPLHKLSHQPVYQQVARRCHLQQTQVCQLLQRIRRLQCALFTIL